MEFSIDGVLKADLSNDHLLFKFGLMEGGRVQQAIDRSCIDWCRMYTPWRTGNLAMNPYSYTVIGSGLIQYQVPYAKEVYYGEEHEEYSKEVNPLAGSFWFERAMADHAEDVLDEARKAIKWRN